MENEQTRHSLTDFCLLICGVIWTALIIKILHVTGVFNG
nr:MAG TPA: hypothetical protein [Caudoviricetes sp.]